ncbi:hypothetical protein ACWKWU_17660 [Chitinophaga lutea]
MILSLNQEKLASYVVTQANNFFPDGNPIPLETVKKNIDTVLQRVEYCFSKVNSKYFFNGEYVVFNHLNADQYAMFLYFLSNTLFREGVDTSVCTKFFLLNKALHSLDAFYEVALPDIFLLVHPMATVLGRGRYSNYFIAYQRCGIGSNRGIYPEIGEFVTLHPGAAVLGDSKVGHYCKIAADSLVIDQSIDDGHNYFGSPKNSFLRKDGQASEFWRI